VILQKSEQIFHTRLSTELFKNFGVLQTLN